VRTLRCSKCGVFYRGRCEAEICFDRSTGIKRFVRGLAARVERCYGVLITRRDYNRLKKQSNP
jgi:hypothetical protein